MQRIGFKMKLKDGCVDEYKKRHDEIWPELVDELHHAGILDFSIFLDEETLFLFAFHLNNKTQEGSDQPGGPVQRKWWDYLAPLMECNKDNSPRIYPLKELFYMK